MATKHAAAPSPDTVKTFQAAVAYAKSGDSKIKLSNEQQLEMYALFKQASSGPNLTKAPSRLQIVERAKWDAWAKLGQLSKEEAMKRYIAVMTKLVPTWNKPAAKL